ncbi:Abi family protein [Halocynthiibacter styelae]|uniref:Abi family protein n=1 Tax=Halocynthiibacter styelae TaxID=2761955 RepID=A0A8J7IUK5_9RHOB|nr:Abi family protein [Paenihalocynthiibacter styelae]MBI1492693.1 Abi family protein [Paenihalocynthiibacter styelae]
MAIPDRNHAARSLHRIGYYRLSAFGYPYRDFCPIPTPGGEADGRVRCDKFKEGTTFDYVIDFYLFDKALRMELLDAIERIEVAVRTAMIEVLGELGPHAHRDRRSYKDRFSEKDANGDTPLGLFIEGLDQHFKRSKEDFAKHFKLKYFGPPPIWIEAGTWTWGNLTHIIAHLSDKNKMAIAERIHPDLPMKTFASWITALNDVRNSCAHHARTWNKPLVNSPGVPSKTTFGQLDHLRKSRMGDDAPTKKIYSAIVVMIFMLRQFYPGTEWHVRLREMILTQYFPREIHPQTAGFPEGWEHEAIWS